MELEYVVPWLPYEGQADTVCRTCKVAPATYTVVDEHGHYDQWCAACLIASLIDVQPTIKGWAR